MAGSLRARLGQAPHLGPPTSSTPTPINLTPQARRTFHESFETFEKTVEKFSKSDARDFHDTTLHDVRDAAIQIERQLAARQCLRNMKRLEPLLNGLEAYSEAIGILCNGTPFVSWIWAPIKLMMKLATDHLSAFEKLMTAYAQIGELLPRFDRLSVAFQNQPDFQQALACVYSDIIDFHRHAYKFLRRNGWACFFKSSWGQFESRFSCILDSLARHARLVDQEANTHLILETMTWRREALQQVASAEIDRSKARLAAALAWLGLDTIPHCSQAHQENLRDRLVTDCCDGTTDWILKHPKLRAWLQIGRGQPLLWLNGKPGSGKSTLCAKIIQFLRASRQSTVLSCFYSYTISNVYPEPVVFILATLISQILRQNLDLVDYVCDDFVNEGSPLSVRNLEELMCKLLPQLHMPRLVIDGIDECIRYDLKGSPSDLAPLKDVITTIMRIERSSPGFSPPKILLVSRNISQITGQLSKRPTVSLDQESGAVTSDIERFTKQRLSDLRDRFVGASNIDDVLHEAGNTIVSRSQGMFLWVNLVLAQLESDAYVLDDIRTVIADMPRDLNAFYQRMLGRLELLPRFSQQRALHILRWMICSRRPLSIIELQVAIHFASGKTTLSQDSQLPPTVLDICKPLIQTHEDGHASFVHFTVHEYLVTSKFVTMADAEHCAAVTCLSYIQFSLSLTADEVRTLNIGKCLHSLQTYAHEHWLDHVLAFLSDTRGVKDQQLEKCLSDVYQRLQENWVARFGEHHEFEVHPNQPPEQADIRLRYAEQYGPVHRLLHYYAQLRNVLQIDFGQLDKNTGLQPPTEPLGHVHAEYEKQVIFLLAMPDFPGLTPEQLATFKTNNAPSAFTCRFPGCAGTSAGFSTASLREQHEKIHAPPILCTHSGCSYKLSFGSVQSLKRHTREHHDAAYCSIPRSVRSRRTAGSTRPAHVTTRTDSDWTNAPSTFLMTPVSSSRTNAGGVIRPINASSTSDLLEDFLSFYQPERPLTYPGLQAPPVHPPTPKYNHARNQLPPITPSPNTPSIFSNPALFPINQQLPPLTPSSNTTSTSSVTAQQQPLSVTDYRNMLRNSGSKSTVDEPRGIGIRCQRCANYKLDCDLQRPCQRCREARVRGCVDEKENQLSTYQTPYADPTSDWLTLLPSPRSGTVTLRDLEDVVKPVGQNFEPYSWNQQSWNESNLRKEDPDLLQGANVSVSTPQSPDLPPVSSLMSGVHPPEMPRSRLKAEQEQDHETIIGHYTALGKFTCAHAPCVKLGFGHQAEFQGHYEYVHASQTGPYQKASEIPANWFNGNGFDPVVAHVTSRGRLESPVKDFMQQIFGQ